VQEHFRTLWQDEVHLHFLDFEVQREEYQSHIRLDLKLFQSFVISPKKHYGEENQASHRSIDPDVSHQWYIHTYKQIDYDCPKS